MLFAILLLQTLKDELDSVQNSHKVTDNDRLHEENVASDWIKSNCPVPSGSKYLKHVQVYTTKYLFIKYCGETRTNLKLPLISFYKFRELYKTIPINIIKRITANLYVF